MSRIRKSFVRRAILVGAILGTFLAGNSWAATIRTTPLPGTAFTFTNVPANLQIAIAGATPAGGPGASYPNNTQTILSGTGTFQIKGVGGNYTLGDFLLLITRPTVPTTSFTLTPIVGGTPQTPITVLPSAFVTTSVDVSSSGNTPGGGSFSALGPAAAFAFVDLFGPLGVSASHSSGLNPFNPNIQVGFSGVPAFTTFIAYGAFNTGVGTVLRFRSAFSESLTVVPEPGTLLLIGSGLVGIGVGARRRKKP